MKIPTSLLSAFTWANLFIASVHGGWHESALELMARGKYFVARTISRENPNIHKLTQIMTKAPLHDYVWVIDLVEKHEECLRIYLHENGLRIRGKINNVDDPFIELKNSLDRTHVSCLSNMNHARIDMNDGFITYLDEMKPCSLYLAATDRGIEWIQIITDSETQMREGISHSHSYVLIKAIMKSSIEASESLMNRMLEYAYLSGVFAAVSIICYNIHKQLSDPNKMCMAQ